jgi:hypothetical protein
LATQGFFYSNTAVDGFLNTSISSAATSMFLTTTPSGYPSQFPFVLVLGGSEVVYVTAGSGTSGSPWTIQRGKDGTTAQAWTGGGTTTSVQHRAVADDFTLSRLHEGSVQADLPHGLPSSAWQAAPLASISKQVLASAATTVTFSSIPATYSSLLLLVQARGSETSLQADDLTCVVNGDVGAHYSYLTFSATNISGSGTGALGSVADFTTSAVTSWPLARINTALAGSSVNAGGGSVWFPNYTGTAFGKMFWSMSAAGNGSAAMVDGRMRMGWWTPATQAAISSLTLTAPGGGANTFLAGSYFQLFGVG